MKKFALVSIFVLAGILRLVNLSYSDYQGDEIKALFNPTEADSINFFFEQRKGPMQFLVTAAIKTLTPDYRNRLLTRLPFALAGWGSVVIFYLVAKELFNEKVALYSSIFFTTNGFLIAFSRIVQYQSLVIFFGLLAVYFVQSYTKSFKLGRILIAGVCLSLSILAHYDGIFFTPIMLGILVRNYLKSDAVHKSLLVKHTATSIILFLVISGLFYVPFVRSISSSTTDYWAGRISGVVSDKISSSRYLFTVYQPIYAIHIYSLLGITGLLIMVASFVTRSFTKVKPITEVVPVMFTLLWFIIPFILLELFIYIPGTHIYTYLIPAFIFLGYALYWIETFVVRRFKSLSVLYISGITVLFLFLALQAYLVFTDHSVEYPWENKKFLAWTLPKPSPVYHLSIFGFPYNRHWDQIGDYIRSNNLTEYYTTNERTSISRYHINLIKDGSKAGYFIYIINPQTFTNNITNDRVASWVKANEPVIKYDNGKYPVTLIYLLPNPINELI